MALVPSSLREKMSLLPSPVKSPVPATYHPRSLAAGAGLCAGAAMVCRTDAAVLACNGAGAHCNGRTLSF